MAEQLTNELRLREERYFLGLVRAEIDIELARPVDGNAATDQFSARSLRDLLEKRNSIFRSIRDQPFDRAFEILEQGEHRVYHVGKQNLQVGEDHIVDWRSEIARRDFDGSPTERLAFTFSGSELVRAEVRDGSRVGKGLISLRGIDLAKATDLGVSDEAIRSGQKAKRKTTKRKVGRTASNAAAGASRVGDYSSSGFIDEYLSNLATKSNAKMSDIVATIQADQDALMRLPTNVALAVEGGPGTGKTVVGLHRLAFVAYESQQAQTVSTLLMVGPSEAFVRYVDDVLPRLGERDTRQISFEALCLSILRPAEAKTVKVSVAEHGSVALIKSNRVILRVLRRALLSQIRLPYFDVTTTERIWIGPDLISKQIAPMVQPFMSGEISLKVIRDRLAAWFLAYLEAATSFRGADLRRAESKSVEAAVTAQRDMGKKVEVFEEKSAVAGVTSLRQVASRLAERVVGDDEPLALLARFHDPRVDVFPAQDSPFAPTEHEKLLRQILVGHETKESVKKRRDGQLSRLDLPLVHELAISIRGMAGQPYSHVMVDEAQEVTPVMASVLRHYFVANRVTLLGDFNQRTRADAISSWDELATQLELSQFQVKQLTQSYRVPRQVLDFAARVLLPEDRKRNPVGVRSGESVELVKVAQRQILGRIEGLIRKSQEGKILIIGDAEELRELANVDSRVMFARPDDANGLEAGLVILAEPSSWASRSDDPRHALYMALTRTMSRLVIVFSDDLPYELEKHGVQRRNRVKRHTSRIRDKSIWPFGGN